MSKSELPKHDAATRYEVAADLFRRATGLLAPGKDSPAAAGPDRIEERRAAWDDWQKNRARFDCLDRIAALQCELEQERSRLRRAKAVIHALVERVRDHGDCYLCQIEEGEGASAGEYFHDAACPLVVQGFLTLAGYPVEPSPEKPDGEVTR